MQNTSTGLQWTGAVEYISKPLHFSSKVHAQSSVYIFFGEKNLLHFLLISSVSGEGGIICLAALKKCKIHLMLVGLQ